MYQVVRDTKAWAHQPESNGTKEMTQTGGSFHLHPLIDQAFKITSRVETACKQTSLETEAELPHTGPNHTLSHNESPMRHLLMQDFFLKNTFIHFVRFTDKAKRQAKIFYPLIHFLNAHKSLCWVRQKPRSTKSHPGLPDGWEGPKYLSHDLCFPG